jgi:ribonuclease VapC
VVDTSALVAIVLREEAAPLCIAVLQSETEILMSAGTLAETLVVSARRRVADEMARLFDVVSIQFETVTPASAKRVAEAYDQWGRGIHPAALNFGDCFAYALAKEHSCPLLFVGNHFSKTDIQSVL